MNTLIDQIDAYLDGTMNIEDQAKFEAQLVNDAVLREQVDVQRNLRAGIERMGMKAATSSAFRKITLKNKIYKWGMATVAVGAVVGGSYLVMNSTSTETEGANITYTLPATNEDGGTEWADADRNLPTQLFTINPNKDTVIETMGGIVFAIPAGAFVDAKDPMTFEVREAITPFDIMKAGLSTTSNGELLETGGMFYMNARNGETSLKINPDKPVCANVPANEIRPGMQLFEGERKADGSINWINPKPLEKQLIPVDIFSLNFYPKGFLEKVAELGFDANDRKVTDSIYYSYTGRQGFDSLMLAMYPGESDIAFSSPDGAALFKANCSSCHTTTDKASTGPGLKGVLSRIPGGNWQYDFVHDPAGMIKAGDPYANSLYPGKYSTVMTAFPQLKNEEIDAILAYADHGGKPYGMEIDPARIAAIKSEEFQNTLIATKEFEERLQVIFSKCSPQILDLYVNNLEKKLYEIDSMAMNMDEGNEFREFYSRHDGGVAVSQAHLKKLQGYYQKKQEAVRTVSQKRFNQRTEEQRKADSQYFAGQNQLFSKQSSDYAANINAEFTTNLKEAYRQLGIPPYTPPPANAYYDIQVTNTGWHNVDRFVLESTVTRTTLDYTNPESGKKAIIRYEELKITVAEAVNYTQLKVYLVTDSLPCFMLVNGVNRTYSQKLNELFEYSLVVIGEKNGTWFSSSTPKVTGGTVNVTLQGTDETSLRASLNTVYRGKVGSDFSAEMTYMKETLQYSVRKEKEARQAEIDAQIIGIIFPCAKGAAAPCESQL